MTTSPTVTSSRPFTGQHLLIIMVVFFGIVIAVNVALAVISARSFTGLVVEDSYSAGQTFDQDTARALADAAKDVHPAFAVTPEKLTLNLHTAAGLPVKASHVALVLGHAVSAATDQKLQFTQQADGTFASPAKLTPGAWTGTLSATLEDGAAWSRPVRIKVE